MQIIAFSRLTLPALWFSLRIAAEFIPSGIPIYFSLIFFLVVATVKKTHTVKKQDETSLLVGGKGLIQQQAPVVQQFVDNRPETLAQRGLQEAANQSQELKQLKVYQFGGKGKRKKKKGEGGAQQQQQPAAPQGPAGEAGDVDAGQQEQQPQQQPAAPQGPAGEAGDIDAAPQQPQPQPQQPALPQGPAGEAGGDDGKDAKDAKDQNDGFTEVKKAVKKPKKKGKRPVRHILLSVNKIKEHAHEGTFHLNLDYGPDEEGEIGLHFKIETPTAILDGCFHVHKWGTDDAKGHFKPERNGQQEQHEYDLTAILEIFEYLGYDPNA